MKLGDAKVTLVSDGEFRLDGGAMFGVVPKVLWQRRKPADERNRVRVTTNSLLVERGDDLLLIEAGVGDKGDAKFHDLFGLDEGATRLPRAIEEAGYELGDVTHVLLSHLHFDHCGWATRRASDAFAPTFPRARYWLQRGELAHARAPNARDGASYDPRNFEPLVDAGVVELFDDDAEPIPGVRAVRAPGHNADMCVVLLGDDDAAGDERAIFLSDLVPTPAHLPVPWVMGFDLYPVETMVNKEQWLARAAAGDWLCVFVHEPDAPLGRLVEERPGRWRSIPP